MDSYKGMPTQVRLLETESLSYQRGHGTRSLKFLRLVQISKRLNFCYGNQNESAVLGVGLEMEQIGAT